VELKSFIVQSKRIDPLHETQLSTTFTLITPLTLSNPLRKL